MGSIILGSNTSCNTSNQLIVWSTITSVNIPGLASSTGTGTGTIIEYDSSKNIIPFAGTYNSVSKINTAITDLQNSLPSSSSYILINSNLSLQQALTQAQTSGINTELFLTTGQYTLSTVATFTSADGQNITITGAGRGTTQMSVQLQVDYLLLLGLGWMLI
jgi:hypothetical protein